MFSTVISYYPVKHSLAGLCVSGNRHDLVLPLLSAEGHVNLSPKGLDTFRVLGPRQVAYLDLVGSGVETAGCIFQRFPNGAQADQQLAVHDCKMRKFTLLDGQLAEFARWFRRRRSPRNVVREGALVRWRAW